MFRPQFKTKIVAKDSVFPTDGFRWQMLRKAKRAGDFHRLSFGWNEHNCVWFTVPSTEVKG